MINPKEAPEGYKACPQYGITCNGCAFELKSGLFCSGIACSFNEREDKENVIFKKHKGESWNAH